MSRIVITRIAVAGLTAIALASGSIAHAANDGTVQDTSPTVVSLQPETHHRQSVFSVEFDVARDQERRFITSLLTVKDTTDRLFLGQELSCTSPSGKSVVGMETGRNFWQSGLGSTVASFVLRANEMGRWKCESTVNLCVPGECDSGQGAGTLTLDAGGALSAMKVSGPLELWSTSSRFIKKDQAIKPGKSVTLSKTFTVGQGTTPTVIGEFSFSNCIEPTYPTACGKLARHSINRSATASVAMKVAQVPAKAGAQCSVISATSGQGQGTRTITAAQHHATFSMEIPNISLSSSPDCKNKVTVSATFRSIKGNGIVIEGGTSKKPMSLVSIGEIDTSYQSIPVTP